MPPARPVPTTAQALKQCFVSPNVADANLEAANVVDVLHEVAEALNRIAAALEHQQTAGKDQGS